MPVGKEEIHNRFGYHPATPENAKKHENLRDVYEDFANFLDQLLPDGRAKSTCMTWLQQSSMWANFAIAQTSPVTPPFVDNTVDPQYQ
jgi:3-methyladenine DNA glycosylase Tag